MGACLFFCPFRDCDGRGKRHLDGSGAHRHQVGLVDLEAIEGGHVGLDDLAQVMAEALDRGVAARLVLKVGQADLPLVRSWLERAADHVLDRLQPPEAGLAYEGGGQDRDRPQDLAARMREAWALRDQRSDIGDQRSAISEKISDKPAAPQSLADRLRSGSKALDHDEIAARLTAIRQGREVEKEHVDQEAERLRAKDLEQEREAEVRRDRGPGHEL